jgi:hypothetical protein
VADDILERVVRIESDLEHIKEEWCKCRCLLTELHEDMIERRTAFSVTKVAAKYVLWFVIGGLSLLGIIKNADALAWIRDIPLHK